MREGMRRACGGCSAISYRLIHERAHATRSLNRLWPHLRRNLWSVLVRMPAVSWLRPIKEDTRCLDMICMVADIADACFERIISEERNRANENIDCWRCGRRRVCGGQGPGDWMPGLKLSCLREVIMCLFPTVLSLLPQRHGKEQRCPGHDESGEV